MSNDASQLATLGFLPPPISPARRWGLIKWRQRHRLHLSSFDRTETSIRFCITAADFAQVAPHFAGQERFRLPQMHVVIPKTQQHVECDEVPALHHVCKHTSTYLPCKCRAPCSGSSFINCLTVTFSLGCFNSISTKQYQIPMRFTKCSRVHASPGTTTAHVFTKSDYLQTIQSWNSIRDLLWQTRLPSWPLQAYQMSIIQTGRL